MHSKKEQIMKNTAIIFLLSILIISNQLHASEDWIENDNTIHTKENFEEFIKKTLGENQEQPEPIDISYLEKNIDPNLSLSYIHLFTLVESIPIKKSILDKFWKQIKENDPATRKIAVENIVRKITTELGNPQYTSSKDKDTEIEKILHKEILDLQIGNLLLEVSQPFIREWQAADDYRLRRRRRSKKKT